VRSARCRGIEVAGIFACGLLPLAGCAGDLGTAGGVVGKVTVSPTCPGPQRLDENCAKPLADARVLLIGPGGKTIAAAVTSPEGIFEIDAAVGTYRIEVATSLRFPRCPAAEVTVTAGARTHVNIECDSGLR
jgi:hypothetical protein